jgi:hypothetical protein
MVDELVDEYSRLPHVDVADARKKIEEHAPSVVTEELGHVRIRLVAGSLGRAVTSRYEPQLDDDSLRAADVAEPVAVLVALQLADEFSAAGSQAGNDGVDVLDGECDVADTQRVRRRGKPGPVCDIGRFLKKGSEKRNPRTSRRADRPTAQEALVA